jgi:cytochrome c biogenesis protein CcmG/thiol:disulfide interchange protein DsbE
MARRGKIVLQVAAVGLVAGLIAIFGWRLLRNDQATQLAQNVTSGKRPAAPAFNLQRLDAKGKLSLASLRGKAVVLNFWASWCEPCKEESPRLERAWRQYKGKGVVFVGIDAQDVAGDALKFARRHGLTYPLLYDGPGSTIGRYGVTGFPETWFVNRQGQLVGERIQGPVEDAQLRQNIELALGS